MWVVGTVRDLLPYSMRWCKVSVGDGLSMVLAQRSLTSAIQYNIYIYIPRYICAGRKSFVCRMMTIMGDAHDSSSRAMS